MQDKILKVLKDTDQPLRPGEIAATLGVDSKELSKPLKELREAGKIHSPKRCFYAAT